MPGIDESPLGQIGRVTGTISPGSVGEVTLSIRGGSECFSAYAEEPGETIPVGTRVAVQEFQSPRSVYVSVIDY